MLVTLNDQEVMKAIEVYMALKGFQTLGSFNFVTNRNVGLLKVEVNVKQANYGAERIKNYANS